MAEDDRKLGKFVWVELALGASRVGDSDLETGKAARPFEPQGVERYRGAAAGHGHVQVVELALGLFQQVGVPVDGDVAPAAGAGDPLKVLASVDRGDPVVELHG